MSFSSWFCSWSHTTLWWERWSACCRRVAWHPLQHQVWKEESGLSNLSLTKNKWFMYSVLQLVLIADTKKFISALKYLQTSLHNIQHLSPQESFLAHWDRVEGGGGVCVRPRPTPLNAAHQRKVHKCLLLKRIMNSVHYNPIKEIKLRLNQITLWALKSKKFKKITYYIMSPKSKKFENLLRYIPDYKATSF